MENLCASPGRWRRCTRRRIFWGRKRTRQDSRSRSHSSEGRSGKRPDRLGTSSKTKSCRNTPGGWNSSGSTRRNSRRILEKWTDRLQRRLGKKKRIVEIREIPAEEIEEARPTPEEDEARIQAELEELIELQKGLPPEPQAEEYAPEVWDETAAMWDKIRKMPEMDRYEKTGGARRAGHADPAAGPRLHVLLRRDEDLRTAYRVLRRIPDQDGHDVPGGGLIETDPKGR